MLYSLYRAITFLIILIIFFIIYNKKKNNFKKKTIVIVILFIIIINSVSYLVPIENLFYRFNSAEDVFRYKYTGTIIANIEGKNSDMIIYYTNDTYSYEVLPKDEKGYKIGTTFSYKTVVNTNYDNKVISIYRYNDSNDYYIIIMEPIIERRNVIADIIDNRNMEFKNYSKNINNTSQKTIIYYTYIDNYNENYSIIINDSKVEL
jgi:hypothetical protein